MGANEKYEAAMHGGEHDFGSADPVSANRVRFMSESELDRFIAKIRAEAKAEALNEAADKIDQIHSFGELPNGAIREEFRKEYWAFTEASKADWLRIRAIQYKESPNA